MLIIFYSLLMLSVGRCSDDLTFETKTVDVGDIVTLTCPYQKSDFGPRLFWIRLVSGNFHEVLGGTYISDTDGVPKTYLHLTTKQEPGTFDLHIEGTKQSDAGVYYCVKVDYLEMTFLNGTFLRIKGSEANITAIIQVPPSNPVHPGDSVTLQCLVLYSFSKTINSSDAGTSYCAVATHEQILFGNGTVLDIHGLKMLDSQKDNTTVFVLCAALATSLIIIALLIYIINKKTCGCYKAAVVVETNATTDSGDRHSQQRDEDSLAYAAPAFTKRKAGKAERRNGKSAEGETNYSGIRSSGNY